MTQRGYGNVGGDVAAGFGRVADEFTRNFRERREIGAAIAVYRDGAKVVDLWGGTSDRRRQRAWRADTMVPVFSTTKGMSAAAMAVAHSRGLFELDEPVCTYWPDFAQHGKQGVTVRQLLAHEAGLAVIDTKLDLAAISDPERLDGILAAQTPRWTPGARHGYHAQTLGWYESALLRKTDPRGRSVGTFFADEVATPLDVDFFIGLPDEIAGARLAVFTGGGRIAAALHAHQMPKPLLLALLDPRSTTAKAFGNPKVLASSMATINRRDVLRLEFPSMNGVGEVRAVAKIYGTLATGGSALGLNQETIDELEAEAPATFDEVFRLDSAFAMGFMKPFPILPFGASTRAYGHSGMGGSFGFADPDNGIGYAYAMNRAGYSLPTDPRETALRNAVRLSSGTES